jgi:5'(3')-deoxyribonucleotidase
MHQCSDIAGPHRNEKEWRCAAAEKTAVGAILHEGSVYLVFSVVSDSQEALKELAKFFEVPITSTAMDYPKSIN